MSDTGLTSFILAAMRATPDQIARARKYDIPTTTARDYLDMGVGR